MKIYSQFPSEDETIGITLASPSVVKCKVGLVELIILSKYKSSLEDLLKVSPFSEGIQAEIERVDCFLNYHRMQNFLP